MVAYIITTVQLVFRFVYVKIYKHYTCTFTSAIIQILIIFFCGVDNLLIDYNNYIFTANNCR